MEVFSLIGRFQKGPTYVDLPNVTVRSDKKKTLLERISVVALVVIGCIFLSKK